MKSVTSSNRERALAGGSDWASAARGIGVAARAVARLRVPPRRRGSPAALGLHQLPVSAQPRTVPHERAA